MLITILVTLLSYIVSYFLLNLLINTLDTNGFNGVLFLTAITAPLIGGWINQVVKSKDDNTIKKRFV